MCFVDFELYGESPLAFVVNKKECKIRKRKSFIQTFLLASLFGIP